MATARFFIVYIERRPDIPFKTLEQKMNLSYDWYRLGETLWIIYTTSDVDKWYSRLSPLVKNTGSLFICKLNVSQRQGWMKNSFWKWLRREKET